MRRFIRDEEGVHFDRPFPSYEEKDFVPLEVKAGSLVVIHGDLIHQRWVFKNHCSINSCSFTSLLNFYLFDLPTVLRISLQNQGMPTAFMQSILLVANGHQIIG